MRIQSNPDPGIVHLKQVVSYGVWCVYMQVSCAVESFYEDTPPIISRTLYSNGSHFVGFRVESVSYVS